jgi:hypothetical protein
VSKLTTIKLSNAYISVSINSIHAFDASAKESYILCTGNSEFLALASLARTYVTKAILLRYFHAKACFPTGIDVRRSSLAPHTFNQLIFVHDNARLGL